MRVLLLKIWPLCLIAGAAAIGVYFGETFIQQFAFHKSLAFHFPFYQLITGHLSHANLNHYLLNMGGLIAIVALFYEYVNAKNQCVLFVAGTLSISIAMYWLYPKEIYVGLSAYLHFLFAWAVIQDLQTKRISTYLLMSGLIAKVVYELGFYQPGSTEALIQMDVATETHAIGAFCGAVAGIIHIWIRRKKSASST
ncbi:rhombosortase [Agaribacter flavus]|uniref:Rhombosortase n=1 Tax=Agaribacter flavus TaxID=1902781 RepID=A0ABV7FN55_9ALTE